MVWDEILFTLGHPENKSDRLQLITNQHLALEDLQYRWLSRAIAEPLPADSAILEAMTREGRAEKKLKFDFTYPRTRISRDSHALADESAEILTSQLPKQFVSDPTYQFGTTDPTVNAFELIESAIPPTDARPKALLRQLLGYFGQYSRMYLRAILARDAGN
jgi:hypothetical protein